MLTVIVLFCSSIIANVQCSLLLFTLISFTNRNVNYACVCNAEVAQEKKERRKCPLSGSEIVSPLSLSLLCGFDSIRPLRRKMPSNFV